MSSAQVIHEALQQVAAFRQQREASPPLARACIEVKRFQARRFHAAYSDLLASPRYQAAAAFFLEELYSEKDYSERDTQFARIASTIARLFPQAVVDTAAALAQVHALTESLDNKMAQEWLADQAGTRADDECARYIRCWRRLGDAAARQRQLDVVIHMGHELERLTGTRGLRTLLRMMRRPASAAGLSALQHFLEAGFDAFAGMRGADEFLRIVAQRESGWSHALFNDDLSRCGANLRHLLASDHA